MSQRPRTALHRRLAPIFERADAWARLSDAATNEDIVRARAVFILPLLMLGPALSVQILTQFSDYGGVLALATSLPAVIGCVAAVALLRYLDDPRKAGAVFCVSVSLALGAYPLFTGGVFAPNLLILIVMPLAWGLMIGVRACMWFTAACMAYIVLLMIFVAPEAPASASAIVPGHVYAGAMMLTGVFACGACTTAIFLMANHVVARLQSQTERAALAAAQTEEARERLAMFASVATDWLWEVDPQGNNVFFGGRSSTKATLTDTEINGRHFTEFLDFRGEDLERLKQALRARQPYNEITARYRDVDGSERVFELSAVPKFDRVGVFKGYIGVGKDVTDRAQAEQKIRFLAERDKLTGLLNRHAYNARAQVELAPGGDQPATLLAIDLDGFKSVNDVYGHDVGDQLLIEVAQRLERCIRQGDWAARLGGDEFVIVSPGAAPGAPGESSELAKRILKVLSEPYRIDELELHISASIGMAAYPNDADAADDLAKFADLALYAAKSSGRNRCRRFEPSLAAEASHRKELEGGLRAALADDAVELFYQPILLSDGGRVTGFEALARWRHPSLGAVQPKVFIDVAERCGLIADLGRRTLFKACEQAASWPADGGERLRISVNISALELAQEGFVEFVRDTLAQTGLPAELLELEVTETALMERADVAADALSELAALGVGVAMDDFGTGYSSFSHLKRYPLGRLKIDRAFIKDLERSDNDQIMARSMIGLAKSMDLAVVAEGVETEGQRVWLMDAGCHEIQGFLCAMPMPAADVGGFLERRAMLNGPAPQLLRSA